jgi:hypothetical protein
MPFARRQQEARMIACSCWHVGNPGCRARFIRDMLATGHPWLMLGDIIEAIAPVDPRFHCETHQATIEAQRKDAEELMALAADSLIGFHIGNHEDKLSRTLGDITRTMLANIYKGKDAVARSRWYGGAAMTELRCPAGTCRMFSEHSRMSVTSAGTSDPDRDALNRAIRLRRNLRPFAGDLKVVGHGHRFLVAPPVTREILHSEGGKGQMHPVDVAPEWCAMAPSFFACYDDGPYPSYGELAGYPPTDIGWLEVVIDRRGRVLAVEQKIVR